VSRPEKRTVVVFAAAWRVLPWLPGADREDEWVTAAAVAEHVHELHGAHAARDVPGLLSVLRRAGFAVDREDPAGVKHWRRTPKGTTALITHQETHP